MIKLSPSILAADPLRLYEAACTARDAGCDELHFDVMDGHFVPNLSFGPGLLKAMKKEFAFVFDVHLMLSDPLSYVKAFGDAGATLLTVHQEANDFEQCIKSIRAYGMKAGASLKPHTPAEALQPLLNQLDRVLLMTVEPGFGGQSLMPEVLVKAGQLREMGFTGSIEADGGITCDNAAMLARAGVDTLVMGTAFFKAKDPAAVAKKVHEL
ncbi:MAG: ribulose-phosphate 3-epimerase [Eubacteriales bacterium]|nr:ribulose-phosphate 3-epimerase [Eubacteriales bacterium]